MLDAAAGVFLALVAAVGLASAAVSPAYLRHAGRSWFGERRSHVYYYAAFNLFWAALLALPLAANLALAWLLIEATTATSALLVAFSGKRSALEAGWKYLVLTTLGLAVALLGIVVLYVAAVERARASPRLDWSAARRRRLAAGPDDPLRLRPDHRRAGRQDRLGARPQLAARRPQRGAAAGQRAALRGAAADRPADRLAHPAGAGAGARPPAIRELFLGFGLLSLAVAVPFLWRPLPWKRLLAYSSLEHMGILALGIGFGTPLAIAGVVVHLVGHAIAKSLGFYAAIPLLRQDPAAARAAGARGGALQPADRDGDGGQPVRRSPPCRPRRCSSPS